MLKEQILNMQLSLRTAQGAETGNEEDIKHLTKYFELIEDKENELANSGMQEQAVMQDVNENNMYSTQNNEEFGNGTENNLNTVDEGTANPMNTTVADDGELDSAQ